LQRNRQTLKAGDAAILVIGGQPERVTILEDRGPLGVGGRRLYRIEVPVVAGESIAFEVPEDDLVLASDASSH
jgi:hypothetical protein